MKNKFLFMPARQIFAAKGPEQSEVKSEKSEKKEEMKPGEIKEQADKLVLDYVLAREKLNALSKANQDDSKLTKTEKNDTRVVLSRAGDDLWNLRRTMIDETAEARSGSKLQMGKDSATDIATEIAKYKTPMMDKPSFIQTQRDALANIMKPFLGKDGEIDPAQTLKFAEFKKEKTKTEFKEKIEGRMTRKFADALAYVREKGINDKEKADTAITRFMEDFLNLDLTAEERKTIDDYQRLYPMDKGPFTALIPMAKKDTKVSIYFSPGFSGGKGNVYVDVYEKPIK